LTKGLRAAFAAICIFYLCTNSALSTQAVSPNVINGSTPEDIDEEACSEAVLLDYVEKAKKYIGSKWQPVKGFEDRNVVAVFTVKQNGKIEDERIMEESGSQVADQSALNALKAASPLPPLPKGAPESIQIRYVFSWHVTRK
jgi:TonB family protein